MEINKKKNIFLISFIALLMFLSSIAVSLYDNVEGKITDRTSVINGYLSEDIEYFTIAKAMEVDPNYKVFSFGKRVPEDLRKEIENSFTERMENSVTMLESDSNFSYYVKNTKTKKSSESSKKITSKSKSAYYGFLKYDKIGTLAEEENLSSSVFSGFDFNDYLDDLSDYNITTQMDDYYINGEKINKSDIKINKPKNVSFTYTIPKNVVNDGGVIAYYMNSWENYNPFTAVCLMIFSGIIALFVLFAPLKIMNETTPFKSFRALKGEVNIAVSATGITLACLSTMVCAGYSINGTFLDLMGKIGLAYPSYIILFVNFILWVLTLLIIAIGCYDVKYIVCDGIWRFLRDDTFIGDLCRKLRDTFNNLSDVDLKDDLDKNLIKFLLLNGLIIIVLTLMWGFGTFLAVIYTVFLIFWLKDKLGKIKKDYSTLLSSTHELAKGNFNESMDEDMGVFNSLKEEFKNIEEGFENAVMEETKSQNMKTELISNVSHDLKTPLTGIKNYVELLGEDTIPEDKKKEYVRTLNQYVDRLSNLIEDLFEVSKVNSGDVKLDLMDLNIVSLIEQTRSECSDLLESKGLEVITNTYDNNIILSLDGDKTYRIFENLFNNVAKYALGGTRVYIDIKKEDNCVLTEIKNISQAQMNFTSEEIVERFVRGDKSRHESGSGLGLAIVKSFTEAQGGSFDIDVDGDLFKAILKFPC